MRTGGDIWPLRPRLPQNSHLVFLTEREVFGLVNLYHFRRLLLESFAAMDAGRGADIWRAEFAGDLDHALKVVILALAHSRVRRDVIVRGTHHR